MRPVFKRSQQVTETPQSGIKPQGTPLKQSNTTPPVSSQTGTAGVSVSQKRTNGQPPPPVSGSTQNMKTARSMSIFATKADKETKVAPVAAVKEKTDVTPSTVVIDQLSLLTAWKQMCNSSTIFDHASKMRIGSVEPTLVDKDTIEIAVANPNVEEFFKGRRSQIISELAPFVQNKHFQISIRIIESEGPQRILSKYEQMEAMIKLNPAFGRLKEELDLSLK